MKIREDLYGIIVLLIVLAFLISISLLVDTSEIQDYNNPKNITDLNMTNFNVSLCKCEPIIIYKCNDTKAKAMWNVSQAQEYIESRRIYYYNLSNCGWE